jgi:hypothetical protein
MPVIVSNSDSSPAGILRKFSEAIFGLRIHSLVSTILGFKVKKKNKAAKKLSVHNKHIFCLIYLH